MKNSPIRLHDSAIIIYNEDILNVRLTPCSIDLIVTSPPYNVGINYDDYDDNMPYDGYLEFTEKWLSKCYESAKPDCRLCLNIPLDTHDYRSLYADVVTIAKQKTGWKYRTTIVWYDSNVSKRTAFGSWLSASAPHVIAPVETIVVFYKERWKKTSMGRSDLTRDEFMEYTYGFWRFGCANKKRIGHPAPFPIELPKRCIKLFSYVGDTVLDPFMGSGSTLIACLQTSRKGIGVEISERYCELAINRLKEYGFRQQKPEEPLSDSQPNK